MNTAPVDLARLAALLGRRFRIEGREVEVVEILYADQALVLQSCDGDTALQENQFGETHRRTSATFTVPLLSEVQPDTLHPVVAELLRQADEG